MVAYSFKASFAAAIVARTKRQTIRMPRARHARPGEAVQLFTGMRTKQCRKLIDPDPVCIRVDEIRMPAEWQAGEAPIEINGIPLSDEEMAAFAIADGFGGAPAGLLPLDYMRRWWSLIHGRRAFEGVVIRWEERA